MRGFLTLALCAALFLMAGCKEQQDQNAAVPPGLENDKAVILPPGMPPMPDVPPRPLPGARPGDDNAAAQTPAEAPAPAAAIQAIDALPVPSVLPDDMMVGGAAIDPLCFLQAWDSPSAGSFALDDCATRAEAARVPDAAHYAPAPGFVGSSWRPADMNDIDMPVTAFIEYRYLGALPGADGATDHAVLVRESGGGTGLFTTLYRLRRAAPDRMDIVRNVAGGDRCNGGIEAAGIDNGTLRYAMALTPLALYVAGGGATDDVYTVDLPDCAVCCYASAIHADERLESVILNAQIKTYLQRTARGDDGDDAASCFDRKIAAYLAARRLTLSPASLADFSTAVQNECLPAMTDVMPDMTDVMPDTP